MPMIEVERSNGKGPIYVNTDAIVWIERPREEDAPDTGQSLVMLWGFPGRKPVLFEGQPADIAARINDAEGRVHRAHRAH